MYVCTLVNTQTIKYVSIVVLDVCSSLKSQVHTDVQCICVHAHVYMCAGEKLSKQELQSNSIIKKLRQKDKQNDQLLAAQRYMYEKNYYYLIVEARHLQRLGHLLHVQYLDLSHHMSE